LIVILTAPPVLDETGMATFNSYFMLGVFSPLDECWNCFGAKEQIFYYSRKPHLLMDLYTDQ
jgi:hypothetical protein